MGLSGPGVLQLTSALTKVFTNKQLYTFNTHISYLPGFLAGPSGIRVEWGIETNGRFEA